MKSYRVVASVAVTLGFVVSHAHAQSVKQVAALDPAIAPAPAAAPTESPAAAPVVDPAVAPATEAGSAPADTAATPPVTAAPLAPPVTAAPRAVPVSEAAPVTLGFDPRPKDAAASRAIVELPIRSRRKLALLGEVGWNGLAGFGAVLTYNAHPHLAFDLAGGLSLTGWKAGVRGRYNLLTGPFTPFVGAGFSMSSGMDGARLGGDRRRSEDHDFEFDPTDEGKYDVKRSEFAQAVIGFEFIHRHGFTMQAAAGYSWLLNQNNYELVAGKRHDDLASALFGSGPVVSTAFGYAFD